MDTEMSIIGQYNNFFFKFEREFHRNFIGFIRIDRLAATFVLTFKACPPPTKFTKYLHYLCKLPIPVLGGGGVRVAHYCRGKNLEIILKTFAKVTSDDTLARKCCVKITLEIKFSSICFMNRKIIL